MTPLEVEAVYEALAETLDAVGDEKQRMFLAKLALLLARDVGDVALVRQRIGEAAKHLEA